MECKSGKKKCMDLCLRKSKEVKGRRTSRGEYKKKLDKMKDRNHDDYYYPFVKGEHSFVGFIVALECDSFNLND